MQNIEMHYFQLFFTWPLIVHVVFLNQCKRAVNVTKGILTCWPPGGRKYPKIDAGPLPVYSIPSLWTLWLRKRACCPLFSWLPTIFCHQRNINTCTWIEDPPLSPGYCSEHRKSRSKNKSEKKSSCMDIQISVWNWICHRRVWHKHTSFQATDFRY